MCVRNFVSKRRRKVGVQIFDGAKNVVHITLVNT
jgi:hypothetical protein